jgi:hypothetical protein
MLLAENGTMEPFVGLQVATLLAACASLVLSGAALVPHMGGLSALIKHLLRRIRDMVVTAATIVGVITIITFVAQLCSQLAIPSFSQPDTSRLAPQLETVRKTAVSQIPTLRRTDSVATPPVAEPIPDEHQLAGTDLIREPGIRDMLASQYPGS